MVEVGIFVGGVVTGIGATIIAGLAGWIVFSIRRGSL